MWISPYRVSLGKSEMSYEAILIPYAGVSRIRFSGYDLSPVGTPIEMINASLYVFTVQIQGLFRSWLQVILQLLSYKLSM